MANETISNWVSKAKNATPPAASQGVTVVRRDVPMTKGQMIMDVADRLWPGLMELFKDVRDKSGLLLQPAHVRGIALNMAQDLVQKHDSKAN